MNPTPEILETTDLVAAFERLSVNTKASLKDKEQKITWLVDEANKRSVEVDNLTRKLEGAATFACDMQALSALCCMLLVASACVNLWFLLH